LGFGVLPALVAGNAKNPEILFDIETVQSEWFDVVNVNLLRIEI
jgi:hypothetical protein